eukprot:TRINITY_DN90755_c0_g1_i1.p1 TRINITY_DN90755_c0_g1~~TRINITY_DN90755_c0_g1_i1.p1  ORF type:complete len:1418 (+),score=233.69 TRINITY_DN90755_c0_g1_i1:157-4410(+)
MYRKIVNDETGSHREYARLHLANDDADARRHPTLLQPRISSPARRALLEEDIDVEKGIHGKLPVNSKDRGIAGPNSLRDVAEGDLPPSEGVSSTTSKPVPPPPPARRLGGGRLLALGSWRQPETESLEAQRKSWLFAQLMDGQVAGLMSALLRGDPDELVDAVCQCPAGVSSGLICPRPEEHPNAVPLYRAHLEATVAGLDEEGYSSCREALQSLELNLVRKGKVAEMSLDEVHHAYQALAREALSLPIEMQAPVCYRQPGKGPNNVESPRSVFDLTTVHLIGVQLLHVAIDRDAASRLENRNSTYTHHLLEAGANVNASAYYITEAVDLREEAGEHLQTSIHPIHLAVDRNSVDLVELLLRHGASPESRAVFDMLPDYTPLHLAAVRGYVAVASLLIERRANVAETDLSGKAGHQVRTSPGVVPAPLKCALICDVRDAPQAFRNAPLRTSLSLLRQGLSSGSMSISEDSNVDSPHTIMNDGNYYFKACADALQVLWDSCRPHLPSESEIQHTIADNLAGGDINTLFDKPLPHGRFYKFSKYIHTGCLVHYAVDLAMRLRGTEETEDPLLVLQMVLNARADVHARARYKSWDLQNTCTALHMAAAGGCAKSVGFLLDHGASVEAMVTSECKAHYTPLLDAAFEGHYQVCELLLQRRANPNVPNRLGRTCLHIAVMNAQPRLAKLLVLHAADVTLKERQFRETPLLCTTRSKEKYRIEDMLCLCSSLSHQGSTAGTTLLQDLSCLAARRDKLAVMLLDFVVTQREGGDPAGLADIKTSLLRQVKQMSLEGRVDCNGLTPADHLAAIFKDAPWAGSRLLSDVLMETPDVQDRVHGPLPVYANLQRDRHSWLPWRRWFKKVDPLLSDYQPDVRRRSTDGRDRPCWLFDSSKAQAEPAWHTRFSPLETTKYANGDHMVDIKCLWLANAVDAQVLNALACARDGLQIYAEYSIRAIVGFMYSRFIMDLVLWEQFLQLSSIAVLMIWAAAAPEHYQTNRFCWCYCAALAFEEATLGIWTGLRIAKHGWTLRDYFDVKSCMWSNLWLLVLCTARDPHALDLPHEFLYLRVLLALSVILRSYRCLWLLCLGDWFGKGFVAIVYSFEGVGTTVVFIFCCFASFSAAFAVLEPQGHGLLSRIGFDVYRGLILGDGITLNTDKTNISTSFGNALMVSGTTIFTIYLLNIMIAALTAEYYKADRKASLIVWRERARYGAKALQGPVWPWKSGDPFMGAPLATEPIPSRFLAGLVEVGAQFLKVFDCSEDRDTEEADAFRVRLLADLLMLGLLVLSVVVFVLHPAAQPHESGNGPEFVRWVLGTLVSCGASLGAAASLGLALLIARARLLRSQYWMAGRHGKRYYLWVCYRADYQRLAFINEEVEKEHIDSLSTKVDRIEYLLRELRQLQSAHGHGATSSVGASPICDDI